MFPLLPLISGIVIGAVGARLLKNNQSVESLCASTRAELEKAELSLRQATISGLEAIRKTSGSLQDKLERNTSEAPETESGNTAVDDDADLEPSVEDDNKP